MAAHAAPRLKAPRLRPKTQPRAGVARRSGWALQRTAQGWCGRFQAMASPCEVLVEGADRALAQALTETAQAEALRLEHKFSRYRSDSVVAQIHAARGQPLAVDDETAQWLDFAARCHALSGGLFNSLQVQGQISLYVPQFRVNLGKSNFEVHRITVCVDGR